MHHPRSSSPLVVAPRVVRDPGRGRNPPRRRRAGWTVDDDVVQQGRPWGRPVGPAPTLSHVGGLFLLVAQEGLVDGVDPVVALPRIRTPQDPRQLDLGGDLWVDRFLDVLDLEPIWVGRIFRLI